jgi:tRNA(Ile)-lysidine synthase
MKDLKDDVRSAAKQHGLWPDTGPVVIGVSGGVDSMVLLHLLHDLLSDQHRLIAVHVNYGLREGAEADEALVRAACRALRPPVDLHVFDVDMRDVPAGTSLQEAARDVRYQRFHEVAQTHGASAVCVAHHRNDQTETVLLRLFRGAGPTALAGMPWRRPLRSSSTVDLVRPLLGTSREEVHAYAERCGIPWREDPTNTRGPYARTTLRTDILPAIEDAFPGASGRIAHAADLLRTVSDATLMPERRRWTEQIVETQADTSLLRESAMRRAPDVWTDRVTLDALRRTIPDAPQTSAIAARLRELLEARVGARVELGSGIAWRERDGIRLVAERTVPVPPIKLTPDQSCATPHGTIAMETMDVGPGCAENWIDDGTGCATLDADRLGTDLVVRSWQDGDRMQPLGMEGTKTVADVLTDAQVAPHQRARTLVVAMPEHIAWIVGHRIDHRLRIRADTQRVARLTVAPGPADDRASPRVIGSPS